MKYLIATTFAALALSVTAAQAGQSPDPVPQMTVAYNDLDLYSTSGDAELYRRLQDASKKVCSALDPAQVSLHLRLRMIGLHNRCLSDAVARAVVSINRPEFTVFVQGHSKQYLAANTVAR